VDTDVAADTTEEKEEARELAPRGINGDGSANSAAAAGLIKSCSPSQDGE
jgi:hypothetical protein